MKVSDVGFCDWRKDYKDNLTGRRFGKWLVLDRAVGATYKCRCDCGGTRTIKSCELLNATTSQCSRCYRKELRSKKDPQCFIKKNRDESTESDNS